MCRQTHSAAAVDSDHIHNHPKTHAISTNPTVVFFDPSFFSMMYTNAAITVPVHIESVPAIPNDRVSMWLRPRTHMVREREREDFTSEQESHSGTKGPDVNVSKSEGARVMVGHSLCQRVHNMFKVTPLQVHGCPLNYEMCM